MKIAKKSIAVIGCGWLGLPFSKKMILKGWKIKGSTTREAKLKELESIGIEPFILKFPVLNQINPSLFQVDNIVINIPPGRSDNDVLGNYPKAISQILRAAKNTDSIQKVVFISSTSVYGNSSDLIDESSETIPETESGKAILEAEKSVIKSGMPYVILRIGGLAGPQRHPGKFLAGRKRLTFGSQSINYLHLEDAIGVINYMLDHQIENEIFNVVAPIHPNKMEFYMKMAKSINLQPPTFIETTDQKRREISVSKLLNKIEYEFIYPDPMTFKY